MQHQRNVIRRWHGVLFFLTFVTVDVAAVPIEFVRDVQPILRAHCYSCHGADEQQSGLRLDVKSAALRGGELYGASIIPGEPSQSPLIQFISRDDAELQMPPEGDRLSATQIATLREWIGSGAVWPAGADEAKPEEKRDHWSFQPVPPRKLPEIDDNSWVRNNIDRFVLNRLSQEGMRPAPAAERVTWLRRVSLDLLGLPPSPEQAQAFVDDPRNDAFERIVDRMLQSPRYGERWAQHWLDVVRYADTHGFEVNTERPNAWPYRDYVIQSFNDDTSYDHFIREQIAGDAFGQDAATGFLVTASVLLPGQIGKDGPSIRLARQDALDEILVNIGQTFLGLSIGCARCHNHKFDPISQRDYYAMQSFVAGVEYADREVRHPEAAARRADAERMRIELAEVQRQLGRFVPLANSGVQRPAVNARLNTDRFPPVKARRVRFTINATNRLEPCIDELEILDTEGTNVASGSRGTTVASSGDKTAANRHELRFIHDGRFGNSRSWMSNEVGKGWVVFELPEESTIERVVWGRDREGKHADRLAVDYRIEVSDAADIWQTVADSNDRADFDASQSQPSSYSTDGLSPVEKQAAAALLAAQERLVARIAEATRVDLVFAGKFRKPDVIHSLRRGDPEQPQEEVQPTVVEALGTLKLSQDTPEQQRRMALADWIANPKNPLTARVMVNRIWQGHFGTGLVDTPNDFGRNGALPTHPDLLDWLAAEFMHSAWSTKHMHRLIVLSATYRQSAQHSDRAAARDADVRLLWRFPTRRLEGEAIRDSILAVSGQLNLEMGGAGFNLFDKRGGLTGFQPIESFQADGLRRMIYAHKVRRERDAVFGAFDCPDAGQSTGRRRESTTPIQALNLFNSRFVADQSEAFAARVRSEVGDDRRQQIRRAYQLALSRPPGPDELSDAEPIVSDHGLATLCRVLVNSNEFVFIP